MVKTPFSEQIKQALHFHGISETRFTDAFFLNHTESLSESFLYTYAGGNISYPTPVHFELTNLPYAILIYVTNGKMRLKNKGEAHFCGTGSLILCKPELELFFSTEQTPFSCQVYFFSGNSFSAFSSTLFENNEISDVFVAQEINADYIFHTMCQIDRFLSTSSEHAAFYINKYLTDILTECVFSLKKSNTNPTLPKHVRYMKDLFDKHYDENHSLEELETILGINRYRLCRDFSNTVGVPPVQYLNQVRINAAKELLYQEKLTIHAVGEMVGIPNTNHFIHLFKRMAGVTPAKYRMTLNHFN